MTHHRALTLRGDLEAILAGSLPDGAASAGPARMRTWLMRAGAVAGLASVLVVGSMVVVRLQQQPTSNQPEAPRRVVRRATFAAPLPTTPRPELADTRGMELAEPPRAMIADEAPPERERRARTRLTGAERVFSAKPADAVDQTATASLQIPADKDRADVVPDRAAPPPAPVQLAAIMPSDIRADRPGVTAPAPSADAPPPPSAKRPSKSELAQTRRREALDLIRSLRRQ